MRSFRFGRSQVRAAARPWPSTPFRAHPNHTHPPSFPPRRLPSRRAAVLGRANGRDRTCVDNETDIWPSRIGRRWAMSGPPYDLASVWKRVPRPASVLSSDHQSIAAQCARAPASLVALPAFFAQFAEDAVWMTPSLVQSRTPSAVPSHRRAARSSCLPCSVRRLSTLVLAHPAPL